MKNVLLKIWQVVKIVLQWHAVAFFALFAIVDINVGSIFFLIAVLSGYTKHSLFLPSSDLFQNLSSLFMMKEATPFSMTLYALEGLPNPVQINSTLSYIFIGISLLTLFTFGLVNVGTAYILRNIAKGGFLVCHQEKLEAGSSVRYYRRYC